MAAEEKKRPIPKNVTPKGQRRTRNPCILSDGSVDPKCKGRYQRSVAGREKLDDYVKQLDAQGASEKDVFMAAVNSLMKRGHGYVGAYLDGSNPGRTYKENEAMAIADAVMTKAGVGSHPGERLSPDEEGGDKEERAQKRESAGPRERGPKAMSVRQQRKQPGGRGKDAMGMPETWARSGTGVDETTTRQRREDGQEPIKPGDIKSDVEVDEQKGTKPSRPETKKKPEPKPVPKREGGIDPSSPVQRRIKELGKPVEPTSEQQEKIDTLMAAKDEMDPAEWAKSLQEMFDLVKSSGGRQREELRDYIDRLAGKGKREAAPLPGSAKAQARDADIEANKQKEGERQQLRQEKAQQKREEMTRERARQEEIRQDREISEETPDDLEGPEQEADTGMKASPEQAINLFRAKFIEQKKNALARAQQVARKEGKIMPRSVDLTDDDLQFVAEDTLEELSQEFDVDKKSAISAINKKFGLNITLPEEEGAPSESQQAPTPSKQQAQTQPEPETPSQEQEKPAPAPTRESLPEERLGRKGKAAAPDKGFKITPQDVRKVKQPLQKAIEQGLSAKEVAKQYTQGTLFPSGLVTDTSATNPLEGGSSPAQESPEVPESRDEELGGDLFDDQGNSNDFRGKPTAKRESTRQIPLPLGRENTAQKLATRAKVEKGRLGREEKKLGKPLSKPRKKGRAPVQPELFTPKGKPRKFNTSEMSYEEFSQSIRSLL
jgi:hypothetical protein